ncbi:MAG TPA: hypothetical protein VMV10_02805 [Pirellulales bacterium]|nr:hypothetical protein [Pirellulales bacterium]
MAKPKAGELRVLKGQSVFGPMTRADLDRLLATGKIAASDHVSVLGGGWITIADYLKPVPLDQTPIPERCVQVLKGRKLFAPLTRQEVLDLATAGRIGPEDLVSALDGPWMRLADFLTPAAVAVYEPDETEDDDEEEVEEAVLLEALPAHAVEVGRFRIQDMLENNDRLPDEWYVRVRGIHSSPLQLKHVRLLYQSREIDLECPVHNANWRNEDWRELRAVPELLAAVTRM